MQKKRLKNSHNKNYALSPTHLSFKVNSPLVLIYTVKNKIIRKVSLRKEAQRLHYGRLLTGWVIYIKKETKTAISRFNSKVSFFADAGALHTIAYSLCLIWLIRDATEWIRFAFDVSPIYSASIKWIGAFIS